MGVEWDLGCTHCQRYLWLGSQKPYKWKGFQLPLANLQRFVALHQHEGVEGPLLMANDGTSDVPWDVDEGPWREDLLSRSFCWDSWDWKTETLHCAQCQKVLPQEAAGHLVKGEAFAFCDATCFEGWRQFLEEERDRLVYDSTAEQADGDGQTLELGCTTCRLYYTLEPEVEDSAEDLALFCGEHLGADHALQGYAGGPEHCPPWRAVATAADWTRWTE